MPVSSIISIVTAIGLGLSLGFILQRGRYCLNSAFRDIIFMKDLNLFRAYLISIVVAIVGSNLLEDFGLLHALNTSTGEYFSVALARQNFLPVANITGGLLFGMGIVLAGGCASGIVYRFGEGQVAAMIAIIGFFFGIVMTSKGLFNPLNSFLRQFSLEIGDHSNPALWNLFGDGPIVKWITIAVFVILTTIFIMKGKPKLIAKKTKGYTWALAGLLIGILTVVGWWVSSYFGGAPGEVAIARGIGIATPLRELFSSFLYRTSNSPFPQFSFLGIFTGTWGVFFIFSVPLGSYLSAKKLKEFRWKIPPAKDALTVFLGSVLMGVGATIAGGCNLGHGITGVSTLALASIVSIIAIILGNWVMVYFKFMRSDDLM